jgi:membrane associated rhomboid family serine protease
VIKGEKIMKVFGRDPLAWTTAIAALVQFLCAFVFHVSVEQEGVIAAVALAVFGVIGAVALHDGTWAAALMSLVKAGIAVGLAFGLHWAPEQQATVMFAVQAFLTLIVREQVTAPVNAAGQTIGARAL